MTRTKLIEWIARRRGVLVAIPLMATMVCFWNETEHEAVTWPLGTALIIAGFCLRVWAQRYIHWDVAGSSVLASAGPYAMVRNPLYVGNLLLVIGATVLSELIWMVPIMAAWWMIVHAITVRCEESRCAEKFGAPYRQYLATVPRWFPRLHRFRSAGGSAGSVWGPLIAESKCLLIIVPFLVKDIVAERLNW